MPTFIIRSALDSDRAQWEPLWDAYNAFYGRAGSTALARVVVDTTWARFFDAGEPVHALVAERDGELLGLAHFLFHRSTIHLTPICYLQDLYVAERARGGGVATALILAASQNARDKGSTRLYWITGTANIAAIRLYDGLAERRDFVTYQRPL